MSTIRYLHFMSIVSMDHDKDEINYEHPLAFAMKASDADSPTWDEAMRSDECEDFWKAMDLEIEQLQNRNAWTIIDQEEATKAGEKVIGSTWAFRRKRYPDGRYLKGKRTRTRGMLIDPNMDLNLDCYVDADFAGLWTYENPHDAILVKSRTGYIMTFLGWCACHLDEQNANQNSYEYYGSSRVHCCIDHFERAYTTTRSACQHYEDLPTPAGPSFINIHGMRRQSGLSYFGQHTSSTDDTQIQAHHLQAKLLGLRLRMRKIFTDV